MQFGWSLLALCGDPRDPTHGAAFHSSTSDRGWFTDPDNLGFDPQGRLWICTDGVQPTGHDGPYVMSLEGADRARPKLFYAPPTGAECCSPIFSKDGRTLFLGIQHPGEGAVTLADVETHWPSDGRQPPRAAIVAITGRDGGLVGE